MEDSSAESLEGILRKPEKRLRGRTERMVLAFGEAPHRGARIDRPVRLGDGDQFVLGSFPLTFRWLPADQSTKTAGNLRLGAEPEASVGQDSH